MSFADSTSDSADFDAHLLDMMRRYGDRCLWFQRRDYVPSTLAERLRVLDAIQRHGDAEAFRAAGELKRWLLQNSSDASVG